MIGPLEIFFLGVLVALGYRGFRVDGDYVQTWARASGLRLTEGNRPVVHSYLKWSRRCRTTGGLIGFLIPLIYSSIEQEAFPINGLVPILTGYLLGAVLAEVVLNRARRAQGSALLVPRRVSDYLPGYARVLQRALAAVSVVLVGVYAASPFPNRQIPEPDLAEFALYGLAGLCILAVVEVLQRMVVARRQPVTSQDVLNADDAIRVASVQVLAGAGIGLLMIVVGTEVSRFTPLGGLAGWGVTMLAVLLYFSAFFFWLDLSKPHGHRARRGDGLGAAA